MNRQEIGLLIARRVSENKDELKKFWEQSSPVKHFFIDNVLPDNLVKEIYSKFPSREQMMLRKTLRERKNVGVAIEEYSPLVTEALMAFQEPAVVEVMTEITGIHGMTPDPTLYASGLSMMAQGDFLNPHLDNSSDGDASKYRVINLLFYVTPDWKLENGGNLELWDEKVKNQKTVLSGFNRLVIMGTDDKSWHSVNKVVIDGRRCCLSNYYFAEKPIVAKDYFHATTFKGRPGETLKGILLDLDGIIRNGIRKVFRKGVFGTRHKRG